MTKIDLRKFIPLLIITIAILFSMLLIASRPAPLKKPITTPVPLVKGMVISKGEVPATVVAHGNVSASKTLELTSEVSGKIVYISEDFKPGRQVDAQAVLLKIEDTDYKLAIAEAKAMLASAKLSLADTKVQKRTAAIEEAQASVDAAELRIIKANKDLANTIIRAPFDTVVDTQLVELGQYITVGKGLGRLLGTQAAEVRLPIIPADADLLSTSLENNVSLFSQTNQAEHRWKARISTKEARVDESTRVIPVVVTVDSPFDTNLHSSALPFGSFVKAELLGRAYQNAVLLPISSLHQGNSVFIAKEGRLVKRNVNVARSTKEGVIVDDGLEDNDVVVLTQLEIMFDGMRVQLADE